MVEMGYSLACEEHPPNDLVRYAQRAEAAGFTFALISDHYHPWVERQGQHAAEVAGRIGDGLVNTAPMEDIVERFQAAGGSGKPRYGHLAVCWAKDEVTARRTVCEHWPNSGVPGELSQELPSPAFFEQAIQMVREEDIEEKIVCGPDPDRHVEEIKTFAKAGYDHVYVHQIGPDQEGFFQFYERHVMPKL